MVFEQYEEGQVVECVGQISVPYGKHGHVHSVCVQQIQVSVQGQEVGVEDHVWIVEEQIHHDNDKIKFAGKGQWVKFVGEVEHYVHKDGQPGSGVEYVESE